MRESTEINLNGPRKGSAGKNRKFFPVGWNTTASPTVNGASPPVPSYGKSATQTPRSGWMTQDEEKYHNTQTNYQKFEDRLAVSDLRTDRIEVSLFISS